MGLAEDWKNPPSEYSLMPFWFWNDALDADELLRQIDSFERNGVHGFVIHPRVGLPRDLGWMSEKLLGFYRVAINEAARRGMKVLLYDEGMYPSGSSCGQVVERWPELACRCLALHDPATPLPANANVVETIVDADGRQQLVIDRPANSIIRGLHYIGEGPAEDEPPAGDILNPRTTDAIIELVYDRFRREFGEHFGRTILGIFTDEPNPLGRLRERGVMPGTANILPEISRLLDYEFRPHLASLFSKDESAKQFKDDHRRAIRLRLEETWYAPLGEWCGKHGIALCGHPDAGDEIGVQRHFQIPGQDLVWRWVAPDTASALEGPEATQGKCSSSAMIHAGRKRNSNEFAGAYGAETTFEEVQWLANWCLIRGVNLLIPHAFYYSIRGPRKDERPPQVGLHTPQWNDDFKDFAEHCQRLCWLNANSRHDCDVAVLTHDDRCPWPAAAAIQRGARDFNYLDPYTLLDRAEVTPEGIRIAGMTYRLLVIDGDAALPPDIQQKLHPMIDTGHAVRFTASPADGRIAVVDGPALLETIDRFSAVRLRVRSADDFLRVRQVELDGQRLVLVFNESLQRNAAVHFDGATVVEWAGEDVASPLPSSVSIALAAGALRIFRQL
ncbi:MAG: hypothetical protein JWM57_3549 [Phycisphaerales bacterium]|nr:hypothetical protein [Phycisphaerales bacterium]